MILAKTNLGLAIDYSNLGRVSAPRRPFARFSANRGCCDGGNIPDDCCNARSGMQALQGPFDVFDSPVWTHRKWIVLGGVGLLGLAVLAGAGALLR